MNSEKQETFVKYIGEHGDDCGESIDISFILSSVTQKLSSPSHERVVTCKGGKKVNQSRYRPGVAQRVPES